MKGIIDRASLGVAVLAAVAVAAKLWFAAGALDATRVVAQQQHRIAGAQALAQVDNQLVQMLAQASAQTSDAAIRQLLNDNGINFTLNGPPAPSPAGAGVPK